MTQTPESNSVPAASRVSAMNYAVEISRSGESGKYVKSASDVVIDAKIILDFLVGRD